MFEKKNEELILRNLGKNNVVLFLGSGFSSEAKNNLGENVPTSNELATKIWEFLKIDGDYDGSSLQIMYDILMGKGIKYDTINELLEQNLIATEIPDEYDVLTKIFWNRIYTTNIDTVIEGIYYREKVKLDIIQYPIDEPKERDQFLESTQLIHLNGKLPCDPDEVIFSISQYGKFRHQQNYWQLGSTRAMGL